MTMTTLRARAATGWRSTTGDAVLVARRRSRQDAGLLALAAVVLAVTVLIALAVPRIVLRTADAGVQGAVRDAGPAADVVAVLGRAPGVGGGRAPTGSPHASTTRRPWSRTRRRTWRRPCRSPCRP